MKLVSMERNPVTVEGREQDPWVFVFYEYASDDYQTVHLFPIEGGGWETHKGAAITVNDIKTLTEKFLNEARSLLSQLNESNEPNPTINRNMKLGAVKPKASSPLEKVRKLNLKLG